MSGRLLFEIALRVLGVWFFLTSINSLLLTLSLYFDGAPGSYWLGYAATFVAQLMLGVMLVVFAPAMAARFYPSVSDIVEPRMAVGPGDIYRTACFVLGVYLLVQTAEPAASLAIAVVQDWQGEDFAVVAVRAIVYAASGLLLVFGSRRIAEILSNLGYDPDTIPKQQFSIVMLLIAVVFVGVLLGVIQHFAN